MWHCVWGPGNHAMSTLGVKSLFLNPKLPKEMDFGVKTRSLRSEKAYCSSYSYKITVIPKIKKSHMMKLNSFQQSGNISTIVTQKLVSRTVELCKVWTINDVLVDIYIILLTLQKSYNNRMIKWYISTACWGSMAF